MHMFQNDYILMEEYHQRQKEMERNMMYNLDARVMDTSKPIKKRKVRYSEKVNALENAYRNSNKIKKLHDMYYSKDNVETIVTDYSMGFLKVNINCIDAIKQTPIYSFRGNIGQVENKYYLNGYVRVGQSLNWISIQEEIVPDLTQDQILIMK